MPLRFRKGIRILPGVRLNLTKNGISSLSLGGKGLTYNIGRKGTRTTGGIPGTGLSYSDYSAYNKTEQETVVDQETGEITETAKQTGPAWGLILLMAVVIGAVYFLRS